MTSALFRNRWIHKEEVTTMIITHVLNRGIPRGDQVRCFVIVFAELAHSPDVSFLRAFGQASKLETLDHSLTQLGHGYTSR